MLMYLVQSILEILRIFKSSPIVTRDTSGLNHKFVGIQTKTTVNQNELNLSTLLGFDFVYDNIHTIRKLNSLALFFLV